jgi:hypothetical protein
MFKVALLLLFFMFGQVAVAQERSIVISSSPERTLMPIIEKILDTLTYRGKKVFDHTTNLNEVFSNIENEKDLHKAISHLTNQGFSLSKENQGIYDELFKQIANHTYFLNIHVNTIGTLLEIQFYLYPTLDLKTGRAKDKNLQPLRTKVSKPEYFTSFIVNLQDEKYSERIFWEITKMFPKLNSIPTAMITSGDKRENKYYIGTGDTLKLSAKYSKDLEIGSDRLSYVWFRKNVSSEKSSISTKIILSKDIETSLSSNLEQDVKIYLQVSDGANTSMEDSVMVSVSTRPQIKIKNPKLVTHHYNSLIRPSNQEPNFIILLQHANTRTGHLKISRNLVDSLATINLAKRQISFGRHSNNRDTAKVLAQYVGIKRFAIDTLENAFALRILTPRTLSTNLAYDIEFMNDKLISNSIKIQHTNQTYSYMTMSASYMIENYYKDADTNETPQRIYSTGTIKLGFNFTVYAKNPTSEGVYAYMMLGMYNTGNRTAYSYYSAMDIGGYYKWADRFPIFFGINSKVISVTKFTNNALGKTMSGGFNVDIIYGLHYLPRLGFPITLIVSGNLFSPKMKMAGEKISTRWFNFGINYSVPYKKFAPI